MSAMQDGYKTLGQFASPSQQQKNNANELANHVLAKWDICFSSINFFICQLHHSNKENTICFLYHLKSFP
jgi:hypothetical protein